MNNSLSSSPTHSTTQKKVRFGRMEIWDLPIELGDNISSDGAPLTLGWEPMGSRETNVNIYEALKEDRDRPRNFRLSARSREKILIRSGYTSEQIQEAIAEAEGVLKQREASLKKWEWGQTIPGQTARKLKKMVIGPRAA